MPRKMALFMVDFKKTPQKKKLVRNFSLVANPPQKKKKKTFQKPPSATLALLPSFERNKNLSPPWSSTDLPFEDGKITTTSGSEGLTV